MQAFKFLPSAKSIALLWIAALSLVLLLMLLNSSVMLTNFPKGDYSVHVAKLHFLKEYGFHGIVPNWYDGFILFQHYPPAFSFFALPLYLATGNILHAFYFAIILVYVLGAIFFYILGRVLKISWRRSALLYLLFYANPVSLIMFYNVGRVTELFAWTLFVPFLALLLHFKDNKINKWFFLFVPMLALLLLAHPAVFLLSMFLVAGLSLCKPLREKLIIAVSVLAAATLTAFWWIPALSTKVTLWQRMYEVIVAGIGFSPQFILLDRVLFFSLSILFLPAFYCFSAKRGKDMRFYLPTAILALLCISTIIAYVPMYNNPYPLTYEFFFLLISSVILSTVPSALFGKAAVRLWLLAMLFLVVPVLIQMAAVPPPHFDNSPEVALLSSVNGRFCAALPYFYGSWLLYAYAAVDYNLSTPFGWFPQEEPKEVAELEYKIFNSVRNSDCAGLLDAMQKVNASDIIATGADCNTLSSCGLAEVKTTGNACLFRTPKTA
ncbi:MAG: 6-pyruvoyl-tetrahydropterin synthase-related protein [Candidatus Diapherotrites archaeon]